MPKGKAQGTHHIEEEDFYTKPYADFAAKNVSLAAISQVYNEQTLQENFYPLSDDP